MESLPPCSLHFVFMKWSQRDRHTFLQTTSSMDENVAMSITIVQHYRSFSHLTVFVVI